MIPFISGLSLVIAGLATLFQLIDQIFDADHNFFVNTLLVLLSILCICITSLGLYLMWKVIRDTSAKVLDCIVEFFDAFDIGD